MSNAFSRPIIHQLNFPIIKTIMNIQCKVFSPVYFIPRSKSQSRKTCVKIGTVIIFKSPPKCRGIPYPFVSNTICIKQKKSAL